MEKLASAAIPVLFLLILLAGSYQGVAVYDTFVRGAEKGLKTAVRVAPFLCAALLLIALMRSSGLLGWMQSLLEGPMRVLGLPEGTLALLIVRPVSGSAALGVLEDTLREYGADSTTGRVAAVMMGSTETVLYTLAVYLGAAGVKKSRGILPVALISGLAGTVAASVAVQMFFG